MEGGEEEECQPNVPKTEFTSVCGQGLLFIATSYLQLAEV